MIGSISAPDGLITWLLIAPRRRTPSRTSGWRLWVSSADVGGEVPRAHTARAKAFSDYRSVKNTGVRGVAHLVGEILA